MRRKPTGAKYRNLVARGGVIYVERVRDGKRVRFSCETSDWDQAAACRDLYDERRKAREAQEAQLPLPSLREFAARYLAEDTAHIAPSTKRSRASVLRVDGPLLKHFGDTGLDAITAPALREWWSREVTARGLQTCTGRGYVDALSAVLGYARDLGFAVGDPIPEFREQLRRRSRTKQARAEAESGRAVRPIASLEELRRFVEAAEVEAELDYAQAHEIQRGRPTDRVRTLEERTGGLRALVAILAMLDAGLRMGEVTALTWGQVRWGAEEDDRTRALVIDRNRPRGCEEGPPKSGRSRVVALSRRLRRALAELYDLEFRPGPGAPVLPGFGPQNFAHRPWRRILKRAAIGHRAPKDLRDTFASWLLSLGVQLAYVSKELGHADIAVTARHYARWCGGDVYRDPMPLLPGEVPADLLARVVEEAAESPHESPQLHSVVSDERPEYGSREAEKESSVRDLDAAEELEHETGFEPATLTLAT